MGLFQYVKDTRAEMKHVAWPTQKQTAIFTALVVAVSAFTAVYLGFFDFIFTNTLEAGLGIDTNPASVMQDSSAAGTSTPALHGTSTDSVNENIQFDTTGGDLEVTNVEQLQGQESSENEAGTSDGGN